MANLNQELVSVLDSSQKSTLTPFQDTQFSTKSSNLTEIPADHVSQAIGEMKLHKNKILRKQQQQKLASLIPPKAQSCPLINNDLFIMDLQKVNTQQQQTEMEIKEQKCQIYQEQSKNEKIMPELNNDNADIEQNKGLKEITQNETKKESIDIEIVGKVENLSKFTAKRFFQYLIIISNFIYYILWLLNATGQLRDNPPIDINSQTGKIDLGIVISVAIMINITYFYQFFSHLRIINQLKQYLISKNNVMTVPNFYIIFLEIISFGLQFVYQRDKEESNFRVLAIILFLFSMLSQYSYQKQYIKLYQLKKYQSEQISEQQKNQQQLEKYQQSS